MISILIATKNRPRMVENCLASILKSTHADFEIIIADQSEDETTHRIVLSMRNRKIRYLSWRLGGKSQAINAALNMARGTIVALTDDDCRVRRDWLSRIQSTFQRYSEITAITGSTYPYERTRKRGHICPSTFTRKTARFIRQLGYHVSLIGFGNNLAVRTRDLRSVGGFRPWIGPGRLIPSAEDAEIELRLLATSHILFYDPNVRVYHDRWLDKALLRRQTIAYIRGESACYAYYGNQGYSFAKKIIQRSGKRYMFALSHAMHRIRRLGISRITAGALFWAGYALLSHGIGILLGSWYAVREPLTAPYGLRRHG